MNTTSQIGSLGEVKVAARLIELGWEVYTPLTINSTIDLIGYKESTILRFFVRGTQKCIKEKYVISLKSVYANKTQTIIKPFQSLHYNYVAAYLQPIDIVCFISILKLSGVHQLILRDEVNKFSNKGSNVFLIDDCSEL